MTLLFYVEKSLILLIFSSVYFSINTILKYVKEKPTASSKKRPVRLKPPGLFFTPIFVLCAPRRKLPEAQVAAE